MRFIYVGCLSGVFGHERFAAQLSASTYAGMENQLTHSKYKVKLEAGQKPSMDPRITSQYSHPSDRPDAGRWHNISRSPNHKLQGGPPDNITDLDPLHRSRRAQVLCDQKAESTSITYATESNADEFVAGRGRLRPDIVGVLGDVQCDSGYDQASARSEVEAVNLQFQESSNPSDHEHLYESEWEKDEEDHSVTCCLVLTLLGDAAFAADLPWGFGSAMKIARVLGRHAETYVNGDVQRVCC
jgi:hypothetical protein